MKIHVIARNTAHYGAAIVSGLLEANLFFIFGHTTLQKIIFCVIAVALEAGKNYVLWDMKHRNLKPATTVAYGLLVAISIFATVTYANLSIRTQSDTADVQSVDFSRQQVEDDIESINADIEYYIERKHNAKTSWSNTISNCNAEIERLRSEKAEKAAILQTMTNSVALVSPDIGFELLSEKSGVGKDALMIAFLILLGVTLELLIYVTEEWVDKPANEVRESEEPIAIATPEPPRDSPDEDIVERIKRKSKLSIGG